MFPKGCRQVTLQVTSNKLQFWSVHYALGFNENT
jgi:hypothetical protein